MVLRRARRGIAETRVLARDEWQESATIPAPGSYKDAHRRSYGIATAPCTVYYDRPRRPTGARPRAGYARDVTACRCPAA